MKYPAKEYKYNIFSMKDIRFFLINRIEHDLSNNVLVTGGIGSGKTTCTLKCSFGFEDLQKLQDKCNEKLMKNQKPLELKGYKVFDMAEDLCYTTTSLQEKAIGYRKGIIIGDEAVVNLARRNAMTRSNKMLHQIMTISRKNHNTLFLLLPSIEDVDTSLLQYVSMWIHIDQRGLGVVFMPNKTSIFGKKRWDVDACRKIYEKVMEQNPYISQPPYWIYNNFRGYIKFGKLPKEREERYLGIAHAKKDTEAKKNLENNKKKKSAINDQYIDKIKEITKDLVSGKIMNKENYYKYCIELKVNKNKFNRLINDQLLLSGITETAFKLLSKNKNEIISIYDE